MLCEVPSNSNLFAIFSRESIRSTFHHYGPSDSLLECLSLCDSETIDSTSFNLREDWHGLGVLEHLEKFEKFILKVSNGVFGGQILEVVNERDAIGGSYLING
jgi:hypothetical protein